MSGQSERSDLYNALSYDPTLCSDHLEEVLIYRFRFSILEKERVRYLLDHNDLRSWITSPESSMFLINGHEHSHEEISPASLYCGMLIGALQPKDLRIALHWYCGLDVANANEFSISNMLCNLIGQLLDCIWKNTENAKSVEKIWYRDFVAHDQKTVFDLFRKIVLRQLRSSAIYCILDGVSFYEDYSVSQSYSSLVEDLAALTREAQDSYRIFKVLFTSPTRSHETEGPAKGVLQQLDVPGFLDTGRFDVSEIDIIEPITRRDSAKSTYQDAVEYLTDYR